MSAKELNIGDYVRTKHYGVCRVIDIYTKELIELDKINAFGIKGVSYSIENIIKSSSNIIDLIEVGDYVNGERITKVIPKDICGDEILDNQHIFTKDGEILEEEIKSIVTKEMFANAEYRVETD